MLLDFNLLLKKFNMKVKGVIQVGCHRGQEHDLYVQNSISKMVYIEPSSKNFEILMGKFSNNESVILVNTACGEENGMEVAYVDTTNQGMSSSLLEPKVHLTQHKEVIFDDAEMWKVTKLDDIPFDRSDYNLLNMDVQGFEDRVLRGGKETLKRIDYIFTEVNREEMYAGNALIEQLDQILNEFERVDTGWASPNHGWGDACFCRKSLLPSWYGKQ
jgi:FkbM family methyltransferase